MPFNFRRALIAMDIAYLPWTSNGYCYVLIIVDLFSKFMEAIPMKNQESATIAEALQYDGFTGTVILWLFSLINAQTLMVE